MNLTMFCDASVSPQRQSSGWGFWIKGDGRSSLSSGGPLPCFDPSTTIAELDAIAAGLQCAADRGYLRPQDRALLIQSDSADALQSLRFQRPSILENRHADSAPLLVRRRRLSARALEPIGRTLAIADAYGLVLSVRHVRGHRPGGGRNWVNQLCDRLAREGRYAAEIGRAA